MVDTLAPGLLVAQALGRWGNWFNQELFGKPTDLPWGLEIDPEHRPPGYADQATFHPTFLYECLWDLGVFGVLLALDRRFKIGHGRMLALYVMGYTLGRGWIEMLRIDTVELSDVHGLRFNVWTSIVLFVVAAVYFLVSLRLRPGREESVYVDGHVEGRSDEPPTGEPVDVTPPEGSGQPVEGGAVHDPETRAGPEPSA
jgi:prolipoprotein diacylglyceryl transferase